MGLNHSPKNVTTHCGPSSARLPPRPPFDGNNYCQVKLDRMTDSELKYLLDHSYFWQNDVPCDPPSLDSSKENFEDPASSPLSDMSYPAEDNLRRGSSLTNVTPQI